MPALKAHWHLARDSLLLLAGIAIAGHETLIAAEPRVSLLALAGGMMGLPAALFADRRLVQTTQPQQQPSPDSGTP